MDAHIIDSRGVYLRTETVDPMGPQPAGAVYETLPGEKSGNTRAWDGEAWQQVADTDVEQHPEPQPEAPPHSCTRRQGQRALLEVGKLDAVESAIAAIPDALQKRIAQVEYEAGTWERSNPFLIGMWSQLGGTDAELDDLFRKAVTF